MCCVHHTILLRYFVHVYKIYSGYIFRLFLPAFFLLQYSALLVSAKPNYVSWVRFRVTMFNIQIINILYLESLNQNQNQNQTKSEIQKK